jgi:hypothetical protein
MSMIAIFKAVPPNTDYECLSIPDLPMEEDDDNIISLDKAWHGIHYLLCGDPWSGSNPPNLAVYGGIDFGDFEDEDEGFSRYLLPKDVITLSDYFKNFDRSVLRARYLPVELDKKEIYPGYWERDAEDNWEFIKSNFDRMVAFYCKAAVRGFGVVKWIC